MGKGKGKLTGKARERARRRGRVAEPHPGFPRYALGGLGSVPVMPTYAPPANDEPAYPDGPGERTPGAELRMGMAAAMAAEEAGMAGPGATASTDELAAWLDANGLPYSWVDPNETAGQRARRVFGL